MDFMVFLSLVYALAVFHRFEHRVMIKDLAQLASFLPLQNGVPQGHDWRQTGGNAENPMLKRAFHISGKNDVLRYAVPVLGAAVMLIFLQSFIFAGAYVLFCLVKWFGTAAQIQAATPQHASGYQIRLGQTVLFREDFPQAEKSAEPA